MTLEEKAEKYARKNKKVDWEGFDVDKEARKEGYIAGATENGIVWHDLRKNPKDLPEEGEYLVCYETDGGYRNTFILKYEEYDESLHWCDEVFETFDEGVIAWTEIPKFEE